MSMREAVDIPSVPFSASDDLAPGLERQLEGVLRTIIQLPWLGANAGGIFLADPESRRLELVSQINFTPFIRGTCAQVAYGHCLCGRVAESQRLLYVSCVDERHEVHYEGMSEHGHYVVPIQDAGRLLGVMTLYVAPGHVYNEAEAATLENFASTLAAILLAARQRRNHDLFSLIVANSSHGVMITDRERRILWVNPAFEKTTGYTLDEVRGETPALLSSGRHDKAFYRRMWDRIGREACWQGEVWNRRKSGEVYPEWLNIIALRNDEGEVVRYAGMFVDLSEIRQAEEKIWQLAYHDKLTGLANEERLRDRLDEQLGQLGASVSSLVLLAFDLDYFHDINEGLGRRIGDHVLREVAGRLREAFPGAIGARTGADEFMLAVAVAAADSVALSELGQALQRCLARPFEIEQQRLQLDCTVGGARARKGDDAEALIQRANMALRQARDEALGSMREFDEEVGREMAFQRYVATQVGRAVARGELIPVYQFQYGRERNLVGAEVLSRWCSPEHGWIPPDRFIAQAEVRGSIAGIGNWVFEQAMAQWLRWVEEGRIERDRFTMAVNVSPVQLMMPETVGNFFELCQRYGVPPDQVEIELTETGIMRSGRHVERELAALAERGFRVAIDDFGTGHSSLARLHRFPLHRLKVDRGFVSLLDQNTKHRTLVRTIINLAHDLGCEVVAEGIETEAQWDILLELGCDFFQGYLLARPLEAEACRFY